MLFGVMKVDNRLQIRTQDLLVTHKNKALYYESS